MMAAGHLAGAAALTLGAGLALVAAGRDGAFVAAGDAQVVGEIIVATLAALPFAAGPWSPDADLPSGRLAWLGHRYAAHWWGWPVAVMFVLVSLGAPFVAFGPILGWFSHIWPCDWIFGKGGQHVPRGIPRWPWRGAKRHGLNLRTTANNSGLSRALFGKRDHAVLELWATFGLLGVVALESYALASLA